MIFATLAWGAALILLGEPLAGWFSVFYAAVTAVSVWVFSRTRRHHTFLISQLLLGLAMPALDVLLMGGLTRSSAMILWCLISPLGALVLSDLRAALRWWALFFAVVIALGLLSPWIQTTNDLPTAWANGLFLLNVVATSGLIAFALVYFISQKNDAYHRLHFEEQKSERLLLNVPRARLRRS